VAAASINSNFSGRWDRNRTCKLRFWSTRRTVQTRLETSKLPCRSVVSFVVRAILNSPRRLQFDTRRRRSQVRRQGCSASSQLPAPEAI
jgi:hypothetical protein